MSTKRNGGGTVLNVVPDTTRFFNAVVFDVDECCFRAIEKREKRYDKKHVLWYDFKTNTPQGQAVLFEGKEEGFDNMSLPNERYLELCREGAYSFGAEFGEHFDATTHINSNQTLAVWLENR